MDTPVDTQAVVIKNPATRTALRLIFCILLMDVVGITILIPVTPYILQRYSSDALMVTMVTSVYAAAQFFAAPILGKLSDRYGRRPVLLVSVFGSAIGYIIFGIGGALWILFLARLIDGFTAGNMSTASAYIADISEPEERAKNLGLIGVAWGVGLVIGPALGAVFSRISLEAPAFAAAALSLLNVLLAFFLLPESLPKVRRETAPIHVSDFNPFTSIGAMIRRPTLGVLLLVLCLFNFAFNGINSTQTLFLIDKFDAQPWQAGLLLVLAGITVAAVQMLFVQRVVERYSERLTALMSLLGLGLGAVAIFFAPRFELIYPLTVFNSSMSTFTFPTIGTLTTNRVMPHEYGVLMGVTTALNSLMTIFAPLWAGAMFDAVMPGAAHWMSAIIYVLAALILVRVNTGKEQQSTV